MTTFELLSKEIVSSHLQHGVYCSADYESSCAEVSIMQSEMMLHSSQVEVVGNEKILMLMFSDVVECLSSVLQEL